MSNRESTQLNVETNTTDIPNVIGTIGSALPSRILLCGATDEKSDIQPLQVNALNYLNTTLRSFNGSSTAVSTSSGNFGSATLRVCVATDDINLASINASLNNTSNILFRTLAVNGGATSNMGINEAVGDDFEYTSTQNGTFIEKLVLVITDNGAWSKELLGGLTSCNNGFRFFFNKGSKTYLTGALLTNNDINAWVDDYRFFDNGAGDDILRATILFRTPILLDNTQTIGIELGIDDYSGITNMSLLVTGYEKS